MGDQWKLRSEMGLRFFGKMTASISHEIKNALAIMNENAGLIGDLCLMAQKGKPVETQRFQKLASNIGKQVRRADGIVRSMNAFAHSVDESTQSVDLEETLLLVLSLGNRIAAMRGVALEVTPSEDRVSITTNPFYLENLIWLCLDFAVDVCGSDKKVVVFTERSEKGARIGFSGLAGLSGSPESLFPSVREEALLEVVGGQLKLKAQSGEMVLTLPGVNLNYHASHAGFP